MLNHDFMGRVRSIVLIIDDGNDHIEARRGKSCAFKHGRTLTPVLRGRGVADVAHRVPTLAEGTHALDPWEFPEVHDPENAILEAIGPVTDWRKVDKTLRPGPDDWPR